MSDSAAIPLWDGESEGVIVISDAGELYTNQTGGVACNHPEARGTFIHLAVPEELQTFFCRSRAETGGYLDDEEAAAVNAIFISNLMPMMLEPGARVEEAWVPVRYGLTSAILTWNNCD